MTAKNTELFCNETVRLKLNCPNKLRYEIDGFLGLPFYTNKIICSEAMPRKFSSNDYKDRRKYFAHSTEAQFYNASHNMRRKDAYERSVGTKNVFYGREDAREKVYIVKNLDKKMKVFCLCLLFNNSSKHRTL